MESISFLDLFSKGGLIAWPILACSVVGLGIIFERTLYFASLAGKGRRTLEDLRGRIARGGDIHEIAAVAASVQHPVARVAATYIANADRPRDLRMELIRKTGAEELENVERRLRTLATISHVAPLLGLLGTVVGMVIAFAQIEGLEGAARPSDLAGGIWEALLTTVFGLIVAIPCMAAYHGFESRADRVAREMEAAVTDLDDWFNRASSGGNAVGLRSPHGAEGGSFDAVQ